MPKSIILGIALGALAALLIYLVRTVRRPPSTRPPPPLLRKEPRSPRDAVYSPKAFRRSRRR